MSPALLAPLTVPPCLQSPFTELSGRPSHALRSAASLLPIPLYVFRSSGFWSGGVFTDCCCIEFLHVFWGSHAKVINISFFLVNALKMLMYKVKHIFIKAYSKYLRFVHSEHGSFPDTLQSPPPFYNHAGFYSK